MTQQEISGFEFEPSLKIQVHARYRPTYLAILFHVCSALTLSLLYRFCSWFSFIEKHLFTLPCSTFQEATHVFIQSSLGPTELITLKRMEGFVILDYHGSRFLLKGPHFVPLNSLPRTNVPHASLLFGPNKITFIHRPYIVILYERIFSPYNVFQSFCIALWALQGSWVYVYVIAGITITFAIFALKADIEAQRGLRKITRIKDEIVAMNDGTETKTTDLLPGDLIRVSLGTVPADVIITSGTVLVDESMLNGESAAVAKTGASVLPDSANYVHQSQNMLYAGTTIKASTPVVTAMVWATGNMTVHSKMLQSIAYPRQHTSPFYQDVHKVTMAVMLSSSFVALLVLVFYLFNQCSWKFVARSTDLFAIIFELYSIISAGTFFAYGRLKMRGIICRVADSLISASLVNTVCFDKTGTLTEDSMRLLDEGLGPILEDQRIVMAACHTLHSVEGNLMGDVMDLEAFKQSGATLNADATIILDNAVLQIEESFFFCPKLRRQTVLLRDGMVLTKGAPEKCQRILARVPERL